MFITSMIALHAKSLPNVVFVHAVAEEPFIELVAVIGNQKQLFGPVQFVHPLHKPEFKDTYGSVHKVDLPNRNADNSLVEIPQCFDIDKRQFEIT